MVPKNSSSWIGQIMQELRKHMVEMLRRQGTKNVILMESITFLIWDSFIGQLDVNSSIARHTMAQTGARPKTTSASKHYLQAPVSVCSGTSSPGSTRIRKISGSMVLPPSLSESNISCADLSDRLSCSLWLEESNNFHVFYIKGTLTLGMIAILGWALTTAWADMDQNLLCTLFFSKSCTM